jgi:outer membrane biosynthesis protein TonB
VDVDILPEEPEAPAPAETQPELPSEQDLLTQTEEETVVLKPKTEPKKETVKPKEVVKPKEPVKKPEKTEAEKAAEAKRLAEEKGCQRFRKGSADGRQQRYFRQRHGNRRQQGRQFIHRSEDRNRRLRNI